MKGFGQIQKNIRVEIAGVVFLAAAFLMLVCLVKPSVGVMGIYIDKILKVLAGEGRYLFPVCLAITGVNLIMNKKQKASGTNTFGYLLFLTAALSLIHFPIPVEYALSSGLKGEGGGITGGLVYFVLQKSFGMVGTVIILTTLFTVSILLVTNNSLVFILRSVYSSMLRRVRGTVKKLGDFVYTEVEEPEVPVDTRVVKGDKSTAKKNDFLSMYEEQAAGLESELKKEKVISIEEFYRKYGEDDHEEGEDSGAAEDTNLKSGGIFKQVPGYKLPPVSLLSRPSSKKDDKIEKNININVRRLEDTLQNFGVRAKVSKVARGPVITRYEVQPPPGIKVSRITGLADDIALGMAATGVRIEAPVPGKAVMGIEVPNKEISMVYLRELVESIEFTGSPSRLTLALGKDVAGKPVVGDLQKMPHLLIAGATGSGKSVCLNTVIASILFKAAPLEVKFLIIDPKMVELATFNGIPHLVSPVVTDPKKAATSLRWAVKEMEKRYEIFASAGVRDIFRYNKLKKEKGEVDKALPLIVIIIDELADLMMVAPAEVEDAICRLAQMSRAAGMHLVIATQRPSVDVITGLIKANIPSRISFAVSSGIDSRTIMDMGGAEKLLGKGDMLFYPVGAVKPRRVQGAYLSDGEVEDLVAYLKKQEEPDYEEGIRTDFSSVHPREMQLEDVLLPKAIQLVIEAGYASISMLQRRLYIGYSRAARLIDIMEKKGYVGGYEGSKPRSVKITMEQYEQTYKNANTEN